MAFNKIMLTKPATIEIPGVQAYEVPFEVPVVQMDKLKKDIRKMIVDCFMEIKEQANIADFAKNEMKKAIEAATEDVQVTNAVITVEKVIVSNIIRQNVDPLEYVKITDAEIDVQDHVNVKSTDINAREFVNVKKSVIDAKNHIKVIPGEVNAIDHIKVIDNEVLTDKVKVNHKNVDHYTVRPKFIDALELRFADGKVIK